MYDWSLVGLLVGVRGSLYSILVIISRLELNEDI